MKLDHLFLIVVSILLADLSQAKLKKKKHSDHVFFDIEADGEPLGRMIFGMFPKTPKSIENFIALAEGSAGIGKQGYPLHYKGSTFHRVIPGFMAQGGDITLGNGAGGESIWGNTFDDERTKSKNSLTERGRLAMANYGPNTNNS